MYAREIINVHTIQFEYKNTWHILNWFMLFNDHYKLRTNFKCCKRVNMFNVYCITPFISSQSYLFIFCYFLFHLIPIKEYIIVYHIRQQIGYCTHNFMYFFFLSFWWLLCGYTLLSFCHSLLKWKHNSCVNDLKLHDIYWYFAPFLIWWDRNNKFYYNIYLINQNVNKWLSIVMLIILFISN